jgi:hypothetical protein
MSQIKKSHKLDGVCYDIRGPVLAQARKMEDEGQKVLKLNIGNPAAFGFDMPEDIQPKATVTLKASTQPVWLSINTISSVAYTILMSIIFILAMG